MSDDEHTEASDDRPVDDHAEPEPAEPEPRARRHRQLEIVIAVALGLAAIAGAFAAYKNEERNHAATIHFTEGITNFDHAGQLFATANSTMSRDQAQFLAYVSAKHDNKPTLAEYIRTHLMDPRLQAAVAWWESPANMGQAHPAQTPFTAADPNYSIPEQTQAVQRTAASEVRFNQGKVDQEGAAHFELIGVIIAASLFLYGVAGVASEMTIRIGALVSGIVIFLIALALEITG